MAELKLQVGEDYLNGKFETTHIQSYSSLSSTYTDTQGTRYKENGSVWIFKGHSDYDLITHLPKDTSKEPTDLEILRAFWTFESKFDGDEYQTKEDMEKSWIAAIEWYKQQIS